MLHWPTPQKYSITLLAEMLQYRASFTTGASEQLTANVARVAGHPRLIAVSIRAVKQAPVWPQPGHKAADTAASTPVLPRHPAHRPSRIEDIDLGFCAARQCAFWRFGQSLLPCDPGEYEKCAPDCAEQQAHNPKPAFPCKGGNCRDGNRDLEHGHAAREHFVLVKV